MGLEQRCIICLYFSCLLNFGLTQLKHQSSSMHYMGNFPYRNILSFVKGNQSCDVSSRNMLSILKKEVHDQDESVSDYTCLLFLDDDLSEENSVLRIRDVYAEIHEYDVEYKFRLNPFKCKLEKDLPNVNLSLTCFQRKDYVAKACQNGKGCDDDLELCQNYRDFQKSICIPKRKYNESCGMHSQCYKNTICIQTEQRKSLCLCKEGFEFMNGDCLKVGIALAKECVDSRQCIGGEITTECVYDAYTRRRACSCSAAFIEINGKCLQRDRRLYEPCESSLQCRGTHGAKECRNVAGVKFCYCPDGYDIINGRGCMKVGKSIGEACYVKEHCTGTQNAHQCQLYNETGIRICQCNPGFLQHVDQCLQANRMLYEDCILDDQCNGTSGAGVCKTVRGKGLCVCASNYIEDKDTLRCRRAKKNIFDTCKIDEQCTGTENAGVCLYDKRNETGVCACNDGYIWHKERCIKSDIFLFGSCEYDIQCNGTEGADVCKTFGERQICYCKPGHLEFQGRCIEGEKHLGEPCETNKQCLSVEDNVICGQNLSCSCNDGYFKVGQECVKDWLFIQLIMYQRTITTTPMLFLAISEIQRNVKSL
ncbi:fibrillin-2-like [Saccostrea cucullata]|uniref:fibrillin-2-like n=1 Tax=Saccostrea cuccullata TaxID=36930 RepID=UPI002ED04C08